MNSDGYISNTQFDINTLYFKTNTKTKFGDFQLQTGYSMKNFGANYLPNYEDEKESTSPGFVNISLITKEKINTYTNI